MQEQDQAYMAVALDMAKAAYGQTSPNPVVGAVVVNEGAIVGMGAHLKAGGPHAEVHALQMAGDRAKGATLYVTLEPCSHHGRTPPCAEAILAAGIARVVVASLDPNPLVGGRGIAMLRGAGCDVTTGVLEAEARRLNEVFFHYITAKKPFVTVKTASTLDGKIATRTGHSRWVTGESSRAQVHQLRRQHDAILVGVGTVLADDPALTARTGDGKELTGKQPIRIILDSTLRTPLDAQVVADGLAATWIYTTDRAPQEKRLALLKRGVDVIVVAGSDERQPDTHVSIEQVLTSLGSRGITSLLVEGGAAVNGAFLQARAIHKLISFLSLKLIGGSVAPAPFGGNGFALMDEAIALTDIEVTQIDASDLCITGYPVWE